jgi:predicted CXXCH cytochrome family protein
VTPLQQYLVELLGGRLQSLTLVWDTESRRWFSLYPKERFQPDDPLHWTGRYQNWNLMCAECHTTDLVKGYDPASDSYRTTWAEMGVGCEACHGPGKKHVEWAQALKPGDPAGQDNGLAVDFKVHDHRYQVDSCAACHARRGRITAEPHTGKPFLDRFMPELLRAGMYHADGQILDEVYEYGSFLQSKMYRQGVRCSDCHEPHSLKLRAEGNALCVRCHGERPDPPFPTLKPKRYDTPEHHFHPAGSTGARCVECHMPAKRYMVVDPRRDHSLRVPRPDLSVKLGAPNACTGCHVGKDAQWAAAQVAQWYGSERPREPHYAEVLDAGRKPDAPASLLAFATDRGQPGIVRATALDLLRGREGVDLDTIVAAARDDDSLVRLAAAGALETLPEAVRI